MGEKPNIKTLQNYQRVKWYGILFLIIGCLLCIDGGVSLYKLYYPEHILFVLEKGLSPEKGQNWVKVLIGSSVIILGIALIMSASKKK